MYKTKYYLWLIGLVICFSTSGYSANNTNIHTVGGNGLFDNPDCCDTSIPNEDCDGDGITNGQEIADGTDPNNPCDPPRQSVDFDCDGDGFTNREEEDENGTNSADPCDPLIGIDCDGDGLTNNEEVANGTDPANGCDPGTSGNETSGNAIELIVGSDCSLYSNSCAADDTYTNACGYNKASVWYWFEVSTQGYYEIKTSNASFNHALTLFLGASEVVCTNDDKFSFGEHLYEELSAGIYYIMITGAEDETGINEGIFCIEINTIDGVPDNQDCDGATPINLSAGSACVTTGSNRYASNANPQPSCSPYTGASVWYTIAGVDEMQISSAVNYSEVITVYEGVCGGLTEIVCKLNGTDDSDDLIVSGLDANKTYYIQVTGNFTTIEANNGSCNDGSITISTQVTCPSSGTSCNDYNNNTINDMWDGSCNCVGYCPYMGDICDDGRPETVGDVFDTNCNCTGQCTVTGQTCDDGDTNTEGDIWTADCECVGTPIGTGGDCETSIELTSSDVSGLYQASEWITNLGALAVNGSLELRAGDYINLKPGFSSTGSTTYFNGRIEDCEPSGEKIEQEPTFAAVKHYPNPFKNEVNLEFTLDFDAEVQVIISDVNGRTITYLPVQNLYRGTETINVSTEHWIAGVYFYQALIKEQNTGILKRATGTIVKM